MEIHSDGRESEVFHKIDGGWRIVHIHYSGPAELLCGNLNGNVAPDLRVMRLPHFAHPAFATYLGHPHYVGYVLHINALSR